MKEAHGKSILLAIGVSEYQKSSGFCRLSTCSSDALAVRDAFLDVWQLNADVQRMLLLTSNSENMPSKGLIIQNVKKATALCEKNDRLIVYFSGHGHRLPNPSGEDIFYLVPQDVYDESDPEALVGFDKIQQIVESSEAKQKILIIDACLSGPNIEGKKFLPGLYSRKFLAEYMKKTKGVVIIASSSETGSAFTQSPNPKLSLFTHFLTKALRGDPKALDGSFLTIDSLYAFLSAEVRRTARSYQKEQTPTICYKTSGVPVLADFSQSIISPDSFDLDGYPITELSFREFQNQNLRGILTEIKRWHYTQEYLESKANYMLGEHLEEDLGRKAASLRKAAGFSASDVDVEGSTISFTSGRYWVEYSAVDLRTGMLVITLTLESDWFSRPDEISDIVDSLDMSPSEMIIELRRPIDLNSVVPGLEAKGWDVTSQLKTKIEAKSGNCMIKIESDTITFRGFLPQELFGNKADKRKAKLVSSILTLAVKR